MPKRPRLATPKKTESSPTNLLTNSSRTTFIRCRRRYYYSYERQLTPKGVAIPLVVGGIFHKVMADWYTDPKMPSMAKAARTVNEEMRKARAEAVASQTQLERLEISHGMLLGLLSAYHKLYVAKDRKKWVVEAAEVPFKFPMKVTGWEAAGKIDLIVKIKDKIWFVEHKTTSVLGEDYVGRLPLDDQIHQYYLGVSRLLGVKPAGVIYNVVQKSRLRQKQKESFEDFCARVEGDYEAEPAKYFWRGVLKLPNWSLERYEDALNRAADDIGATRVQSKAEGGSAAPYYMNTNHCFQFGMCPYVPLCTTNDSAEAMLLYTRRDNPHPELEEEEDGRE